MAAIYKIELEFEFLIVGAGIAGCSLALELHRAGKSVYIIDHNNPNTSSRIAAGLVNPIVPKRVILTWEGEHIFPKIAAYYSEIEQYLNTRFYYPMQMLQIHASEAERKLWEQQSEKPIHHDFIVPQSGTLPDGIISHHGHCEIRHCGRLDTNAFCEAIFEFFKSKNAFESAIFEYDNLVSTSSNKWEYKNLSFDKIVFAEGVGLKQNPWFGYLPLKPATGDILTVKSDSINSHAILKQKHWTIPLKNNTFLAGSNFIHEPKSENKAGEIEDIISGLNKWFGEVELVNADRTARPTVVDRRPFMGEHPKQKGLFVYNGLGTKGCSLITWLTPAMCKYLTHQSSLPEETLIQRFLL